MLAKKDKSITIRVSDFDLMKIESQAKKFNMNKSQYLLYLVQLEYIKDYDKIVFDK